MSDLVTALKKIRETKAPLPLPPGVDVFWSDDPDVQLRPYQIQMVWNMILCPSFLCGDSVGLGKTAMGSAMMSAVKSAQPGVKFIVYTTSSAQRQWCEEIKKFTKLSVRSLQESGKKLTPKQARLIDFNRFLSPEDSTDILVMRYSTILVDGEWQAQMIQTSDRQVCVIYDEATAFKSSDTTTHKLVRKISSHCKWRYGLSATPIENHLTEIYNIMGGLGVNVFGDEKWFRHRYCVEEVTGYRTHWGYRDGRKTMLKTPIVVTIGYQNLNELQELLTPYFWARSQSEVGEQLPQLNTETLDVSMNAEQLQKTEDIWNGLFSISHVDAGQGETEEIKKVDSKMTVLLLHQMVSINPAILSDRPEDYLNAPTSPKEDTLIELLNTQLHGTKCIVFTRFRRELERLKKVLPEATGRQLLYIHGDMDKDARYDMIQKFQTDPAYNLICINQAAFQAVNLQQAANMICLDLPWSWGGLLQLVGRMVRLRSPHAICNLFVLKTNNSIDDHVLALLKNKKGIFERMLSRSASLGVFDETDHEPMSEGDRGFVTKLFDTLTLDRKSYKPSMSGKLTFGA